MGLISMATLDSCVQYFLGVNLCSIYTCPFFSSSPSHTVSCGRSLSPYGFYFISASHDRTVRVWSTDHNQPLRILAGHLSDVDVGFYNSNSVCHTCEYLCSVASSTQTATMWLQGHQIEVLESGISSRECASESSLDTK